MKFSTLFKQLITIATLSCVIFNAQAQTEAIPNEPDFTDSARTDDTKSARVWNLQDADILSVINEVSQETGKNFIVDPRVNGKITLISSKPLRQKEVYEVFLSVLGLLGYSAIPSGNVIKIVPNMESGEAATSVATKSNPGVGDEVVVRVIPLSNVSATQMIPILRPLLPQWSNISSYAPGNVLILLGRASNVERLVDVIQEIDRAANNNIQVVPLKHASANQVATVLNNLQNATRATGESTNVSIAVDERSNSILLGGPKNARMRIRLLISQLDAPAQSASGNTEVVYLRYLQAKNFAPLLGKIAQNILGKGDSASAGSSSPSSPNVSVSSIMNARSGRSNSNSNSNGASEEPVIINNGYIQAEVSTNALIITAPPTLMKALKAVIRKLDIRPAQVLVEAIIAEVAENDLSSLGIQWGGVQTDTNGNPIQGGGTTGGGPTSFPNLGPGIFGGTPTIRLGILKVTIQDVLSLLRNQNGVDILATPSIMVLDNQQASIEIGQDVPFQSGSYSTTGASSTVTPFNTTDYKKVTLKLDVTPQINLGESVRLKLDLKNDTLQNPTNPGTTPLVNTTNIKNSVLINSNDILVIGGLIRNSNTENVNKIPVLGDLPVLGPLFRQKTSSHEKRNLVLFIKPIIVNNSNEAMTISEAKYLNMRNAQANFRDTLRTIGDEPAPIVLPPWKNKKDLPAPFESAP